MTGGICLGKEIEPIGQAFRPEMKVGQSRSLFFFRGVLF